VEVFRTADVPRTSRTAYWNDIYTRRFAPVEVAPADCNRFRADLRVGVLGEMTFASVRSQPALAERTAAQARQADERLLGFVIIVRGSASVVHCGHESRLNAGDIILSDNTEPITFNFGTPMEGLTARVPEAAMRSRLARFEHLRGLRLPRHVGLAETGAVMARSLSTKVDGAVPPACAAKAAGQLLDVLMTSYSLAYPSPVEPSSMCAARQARVRSFIEDNLADPELSPATVAAALNISPRYLRKLMAEQGETASSFILRRRLEECAKLLETDAYRARSITDIAFAWGFNSTAHFARVFRSKYGLSPRDYRAAGGLCLQLS